MKEIRKEQFAGPKIGCRGCGFGVFIWA